MSPNLDPKEKNTHFQASFSCFIGNRAIVAGENLETFRDVDGLYWLCFPDESDPIARLTPDDINKLAGRKIVA